MEHIINFIENNKDLSNEDIIINFLHNNIKHKSENIDTLISYLKFYYKREIDIKEYDYLFKKSTDEIVRLSQDIFRKKLIDKYNCCLITGFNSVECQACHIIPYEKCFDNNIDNGLLLTSSLHKTFDDYIWSINPKTSRIEIKNGYTDLLINNYNNKKLNLNNQVLKNLQHHYDIFKQ